MPFYKLESKELKEFFYSGSKLPIHYNLDRECFYFIHFRKSDLLGIPFHDMLIKKNLETIYVAKQEDLVEYFGGGFSKKGKFYHIFHTAFSGSTYLSFLFEKLNLGLNLREPSILALIAKKKGEYSSPPNIKNPISLTMRLFSLYNRPNQKIIMKSHDNGLLILEELMNTSRKGKGLIMYSNFFDFLLDVLKSEERRRWARNRLFESFRIEISNMDDPIAAACLWAHQINLAIENKKKFGQRLMLVEKGAFFKHHHNKVKEIGEFFELSELMNLSKEFVEKQRLIHSKTNSLFLKQEEKSNKLKSRITWEEKLIFQ